MKPYARILILAVCLVIAWLFGSCRSSSQRNTSSQEKFALSSVSNDSVSARGVLTSVTTSTQATDSNWEKTTYTFDTSKPANPNTGLPPLSSVSIEGIQTATQTKKEEHHTADVSAQSSTKNAVEVSTDKVAQGSTQYKGSVLSGVDSGLKIGLMIGIPLAVLILGIIIYLKYGKRKTNTSI